MELNSEGPSHQWDMTELDVNVTVNMALLEYKLLRGLLDAEDLQCLFKIVRKESRKTDMVSRQLCINTHIYPVLAVLL